jgi:hypothetical protein
VFNKLRDKKYLIFKVFIGLTYVRSKFKHLKLTRVPSIGTVQIGVHCLLPH